MLIVDCQWKAIYIELVPLLTRVFMLQGGDVLQETISANVSDDVVMLEFQRSDGTLVTQLVDFRQVRS